MSHCQGTRRAFLGGVASATTLALIGCGDADPAGQQAAPDGSPAMDGTGPFPDHARV